MTETIISVVIATRSRSTHLRNCLSSVAQASTDPSLQVVVSSDDPAGPDEASRTASSALIEAKVPFEVIDVGGRGPAKARNEGARQAIGDHLWFIDDDVIVPPSTPTILRDAAIEYSETILAGGVVIRSATNAPRVCAACSIDFPLDASDRDCTPGEMWSCNLMVPKTVFWEVGGFPEDALIYGEEFEFLRRAERMGIRLRQVAGAHVYHVRDRNDVAWPSLMRRRWRRGRNQAGNARLYGWNFPTRRELVVDTGRSLEHWARKRCAAGMLRAIQDTGRLVGVRSSQ